ncbi:unnamed protein product [Dimorphilus gyrociliatus]|uniref:Uncharacterized protein n=1 Tax=Dimorphilus gyrociliatus TaxID=2664684 RepID=A0A7I8W830_9ANNE|nr:unnamed protein product [Dimorphilus gyrociliatus]
MIVLCSFLVEYQYEVTKSVREYLRSEICLVEINSIPSELIRPIVNCSICSDIQNIPTFDGHVPEDEAEKLAYSIVPFLVKNATRKWKASTEFSYEFFKQFFDNETVLDYFKTCQFLDYGSGFLSIKNVFNMPKERAETGKPAWYIGFSSCDDYVNKNLLQEYFISPEFLPKSLNTQQVWLFMGFGRSGGSAAPVHIDQVGVPSWQAQIIGKKTWQIYPTFECEMECKNFDINLEAGDIFVIDTNWWYHNTRVEKDYFSLTIGSEYQ